MPRALSLRSRERIVRRTNGAGRTPVGARLGLLMLQYNVPATALAEVLNVSSDTIYRWVYGQDVPDTRKENIRSLLSNLRVLRTPLKGTVIERTELLHTLLADKGV